MKFISRGLGLPELTPEGYDCVIEQVGHLARDLKEAGAQAISLMGTSLSFYRGVGGNDQVISAMREQTGLPVTTMTNSVLEALRKVDAAWQAVATAYSDEVNTQLQDYMMSAGFEVLSLEALHLTDAARILSTTTEDLIKLGLRAAAGTDKVEALFISCGGLCTLPTILPLEEKTQLPVISSATAGAWGAVRLTGHSGHSPGYGRLFEATDETR